MHHFDAIIQSFSYIFYFTDVKICTFQALKWDLCPMTPNSWLNVFLQLMNVENMEDTEHNFVVPQYSQNAFIQIARVSFANIFIATSLLERRYEIVMFKCTKYTILVTR